MPTTQRQHNRAFTSPALPRPETYTKVCLCALSCVRCPVSGDELLGLMHLTRLTRLSACAMSPELDNKQAALLAHCTSLQQLVSLRPWMMLAVAYAMARLLLSKRMLLALASAHHG